jgi:hypothetical protein
LKRQKQEEELVNEKKLAIEDAVIEMLNSNKPIIRAQQVKQKVEDETNLELDERMTRQVMKKDLHMGYRKAKLVPITCNDERALVLRQQYALRMLALLQSGRRIINIDESWLN